MHRYGLKAASRQCLRDAQISPRRIVAFYLLCLYLVLIPCDIYSYILEAKYSTLSGIGAIALRKRYYLWTSVITVLVNICLILWNVGFQAYALRLSRKARAGADDLLTGFRLFGKVLWLDVVSAVYIFLWSLLFVIPGIIALYRYRMAIYILLDHPEYSANRCLAESSALTQGHKWEIFLLDLSFWWYYALTFLCINSIFLLTWESFPLSGLGGYLTCYFIGVAGSCLVDYFSLAYIQCTYAHCYNWLQMEANARWKNSHFSGRPYESF